MPQTFKNDESLQMRVERISGYKDSWSLFNIASVFEEFFAAAMKMEQNRKSVPLYHITELYIIFAPLYVSKWLSYIGFYV